MNYFWHENSNKVAHVTLVLAKYEEEFPPQGSIGSCVVDVNWRTCSRLAEQSRSHFVPKVALLFPTRALQQQQQGCFKNFSNLQFSRSNASLSILWFIYYLCIAHLHTHCVRIRIGFTQTIRGSKERWILSIWVSVLHTRTQASSLDHWCFLVACLGVRDAS